MNKFFSFLPPLALLAAAAYAVAAPAQQPVPKAAASAAPAARAAPVPVHTEQADYIVAVVNSEPITNHEVRARAAQVRRNLQRQKAPEPPAEQLNKEVLELLITERAELQQASAEGIKVDDETLRQAELALARQNHIATVEELERLVQSQEGIAVQDFRNDVRRQVLIGRLRERLADAPAKVSDAEVDAFLRKEAGYSLGAAAPVPQLNIAMILVAVPQNADAAEVARLQARADEVARRAKAGENFAALANQYSDATGKGQDGGALGLRPASNYPDLFVQAVRRAQAGEVVGPVRSAAGFHILRLLHRQQANSLPDVAVPQTRVSQILLRISPSQTEQVARKRLADFKRRIAAGQDSFEALAKAHSQDDSAGEGGDMGWVVTEQLPPDLARAIDSLDIGQISEPTATPRGWSLLRVNERRQQVLTGKQQRQMARNILLERKAQTAFETWAREVRGRAWVEYRDPPR